MVIQVCSGQGVPCVLYALCCSHFALPAHRRQHTTPRSHGPPPCLPCCHRCRCCLLLLLPPALSGDPFTVMNAYDEWLRVKAARQESSRRWCKRHGLQEQRLYEITKLRRQFEDLLGSAGLLWLGAAAQRARQARTARGGGAARGSKAGGAAAASKDKLRELKMRREGRKRKVLLVDHGYPGDGKAEQQQRQRQQPGSEGESGGDDDAEEAQRDLRGEVGEGEADGEAGLDLSSLEFYAAQDVGEFFGSVFRGPGRGCCAAVPGCRSQSLLFYLRK